MFRNTRCLQSSFREVCSSRACSIVSVLDALFFVLTLHDKHSHQQKQIHNCIYPAVHSIINREVPCLHNAGVSNLPQVEVERTLVAEIVCS